MPRGSSNALPKGIDRIFHVDTTTHEVYNAGTPIESYEAVRSLKILDTKTRCEIHRTLLAAYLALLERVRAAQLERVEILKAGMGSVVIKPLLQDLKLECNAARASYLDHRRDHGC